MGVRGRGEGGEGRGGGEIGEKWRRKSGVRERGEREKFFILILNLFIYSYGIFEMQEETDVQEEGEKCAYV